jgi:hypothetical protein
MTNEQREALQSLCERYGVEFRETDYRATFDLPSTWVAGYVGGDTSTLYVGVSPEGRVNS